MVKETNHYAELTKKALVTMAQTVTSGIQTNAEIGKTATVNGETDASTFIEKNPYHAITTTTHLLHNHHLTTTTTKDAKVQPAEKDAIKNIKALVSHIHLRRRMLQCRAQF